MSKFDSYLDQARKKSFGKKELTEDEIIKKIDEEFETDVPEQDETPEPNYEPEWCKNCVEECDRLGIEYEFLYSKDDNGGWVCDHCGNPL